MMRELPGVNSWMVPAVLVDCTVVAVVVAGTASVVVTVACAWTRSQRRQGDRAEGDADEEVAEGLGFHGTVSVGC